MESAMTQSSAQLVLSAVEGNEDAWKQLFSQYDPLLRRIGVSFRLNYEQAADAAQTTWMLAYQNLEKVREPDKLQGWLSVTMRRECIRMANSRNREVLRGDWLPEELGAEES